MSGTILWRWMIWKWLSKDLPCWSKLFFLIVFFKLFMHFHKFFSRAHIVSIDFMMLFWQEILISQEITLRSHVKHTQQGFLCTHWVLGLSRQSEAATRVRDHFVSGEACLWFDPRVQTPFRSWAEKSPSLWRPGLGTTLLCCGSHRVLDQRHSDHRCGSLPGPNSRLVFVASTSGSFIASDFSCCVFVPEAPGMVSPPDPRHEIRFHENQHIRKSPGSPNHNQVHDIQVQKLLRSWKSLQQSMAASTGPFCMWGPCDVLESRL